MANALHHVAIGGLSHVFTDGREPLPVLDGVSLDVPHGQFTSVIGPSGCGKSTLLRTVGGLLTPSAGAVQIDGGRPSEAQRRHEIGFVFQDPALLPWRTVAGNVRLPLEVDGARRRATSIDDLLDLIGLREFRDYYPHQLSGGMQQRVAIARALAVDPGLLLMDEPFGALDEITRAAMRYELLRIRASQAESSASKTVLFVTHSIAEAIVMSDRVIVLTGRPGRVVADVEIELPRPRSQEIERSTPFLDYADYLRGLLLETAA
jgi:NitT/TauT family transport system ATP-binding protein